MLVQDHGSDLIVPEVHSVGNAEVLPFQPDQSEQHFTPAPARAKYILEHDASPGAPFLTSGKKRGEQSRSQVF